ncbi:MAG: response regulator [Thermodesulfobacteriota bacterium]|nr:response regulator [Thermodesulfobacteriota bacterium]
MTEHGTVLVVEDNELNMKLIRGLLSLDKYQVLEATDAETGIQIAREHKPDLILMDIQLPDMDGLKATQIIKEDPLLKAVPIVAVTSHAMQGDDKKAFDAGCDGYISKPIDTRNFLTTIEQYLGKNKDKGQSLGEKNPMYNREPFIVDDDPDENQTTDSGILF